MEKFLRILKLSLVREIRELSPRLVLTTNTEVRNFSLSPRSVTLGNISFCDGTFRLSGTKSGKKSWINLVKVPSLYDSDRFKLATPLQEELHLLHLPFSVFSLAHYG